MSQTPTTINNNNIVININKNYNNPNTASKATSKLKQVQEESFEEHLRDETNRTNESFSQNRKSRMSKRLNGYQQQYDSTPTKRGTTVGGTSNQQKYQQQIMMVRTSENSVQARSKYIH